MRGIGRRLGLVLVLLLGAGQADGALSLYCGMNTSTAEMCSVGSEPNNRSNISNAWNQTISTTTKYAGAGALRFQVRDSDMNGSLEIDRSDLSWFGGSLVCQNIVGGPGVTSALRPLCRVIVPAAIRRLQRTRGRPIPRTPRSPTSWSQSGPM